MIFGILFVSFLATVSIMYSCVIPGGYMCLYQEFNGIVDNTKIVNKNNCIYESCTVYYYVDVYAIKINEYNETIDKCTYSTKTYTTMNDAEDCEDTFYKGKKVNWYKKEHNSNTCVNDSYSPDIFAFVLGIFMSILGCGLIISTIVYTFQNEQKSEIEHLLIEKF